MKTILLHIRADNGMESRLQAAFDLSRATGAHISCLQIAPLPELVAADLYGSGYLVPEAIDAVRRQDEEMRRALEERLRREGMAWDWHYRSGDLVRRLPEGHLIVEGRSKDVINRGGEKIPVEEIENLLLGHPLIRDVALVALADELLGERSCACVLAHGAPLDLASINAWLRERGLAAYKLPDRLQVLREFPLTRLGKVNRKALAEQVLAL